MVGRWEVVIHNINDAQRNRTTIWIAFQESCSIQPLPRDLETIWHISLPKTIFGFYHLVWATEQSSALKDTWKITSKEYGGGKERKDKAHITKKKNQMSELTIAYVAIHKLKSLSPCGASQLSTGTYTQMKSTSMSPRASMVATL